jgi:UDP:flavonoid glycosyltransferase YjiC (YdhE family)
MLISSNPKKREFMHIAIIALETCGNVQRYIALGLGLQKTGQTVLLIATRTYLNRLTNRNLLRRD